MKYENFFTEIKNEYDIVRVLSKKPENEILLLRHKTIKKELVLHRQKAVLEIYDFLKTVSFKNLPEVYDVYRFDDGFAVLEEYIDGLTVADVIESGLYSYKGAKRIICDVCDALAVLHENGFIHRDIKPENIMISADGTVKLIDFNVSRKFKNNLRNDTAALGTIGYASPEQVGIAQSGVGTDIYALGVLLNVMLTGRHPSDFLAKGRARKIILRCTQISPEKRFESVEKLKNAF